MSIPKAVRPRLQRDRVARMPYSARKYSTICNSTVPKPIAFMFASLPAREWTGMPPSWSARSSMPCPSKGRKPAFHRPNTWERLSFVQHGAGYHTTLCAGATAPRRQRFSPGPRRPASASRFDEHPLDRLADTPVASVWDEPDFLLRYLSFGSSTWEWGSIGSLNRGGCAIAPTTPLSVIGR